jgi:3-oxoacyl-[acyl-carrier protein] reductase
VGKLANKVAVVTGASKGIGAAIARHLAAEGAAVVVNYSKSQEGADRVVRDIVSAGGKAIAVGANLAIETEIAKLFEATKNHFGRVDILVNNAGVYTFAPIEAVTPELYNRMFNTNVLGLLLTTKAALPLFPSTGGSVVNIGSVASTLAPPSASLYAASKAAVDAITKVLAKELGPRKIRVNGVSPGLVATEGYDAAGFTSSDFEKQGVAMTPLGRVGQPDDIALPVAYLASEDARWITGEIVYASGGAAI